MPGVSETPPESCAKSTLGRGLDYFVDINGDGLVDRVLSLMQCDPAQGAACPNPYLNKTYINKYRRPVIQKFPSGLAGKTAVEYSTITQADAGNYSDSASREPGTTYLALPMRVVNSVTADNGVGSTGKTTYDYEILRGSANGHGPQGFKYVLVQDPMGFLTVTTYSQQYPTTGRPLSVVRTKEGIGEVNTTTTVYNDVKLPALPCQGSLFIHPWTVTDISTLYGSPGTTSNTYSVAGQLSITTEFLYDDSGNPITTTVTTTGGGESYQRKVVNTYGTAGSLQEQRGKVTQTKVSATKLAPLAAGGNSTITHVTEFDYGPSPALALVKKRIEPGAGPGSNVPIEMHTAYRYDDFGNVEVTTSCASDFTACAPEAINTGDPKSREHPPFRTTWVSYKPLDYVPPPGGRLTSLPYPENGRFPVKTTNALLQTEFTAYDPTSGALTESTGPNGIHTCYDYDELGRKTAETVRCGTASPLVTTVGRFWAADGGGALAKLVTVTQPPATGATWVYTDVMGRTIETLARTLGGGFTESLTEYDELGQTKRTSKPFFPGDPEYWATPKYDGLNRVREVTQDLGSLDGTKASGSGDPAQSVLTTVYGGMTTTTSTVANGETRTRSETKNVLGKVVSVTDAKGAVISYAYDGEGNLTDTTLDPAVSKFHIDYDQRGRKSASRDPDLGEWHYTYNGFGDLVEQKDAKGQAIAMTYDVLGRMTGKSDPEGKTSTWIYDSAPGAGIGKLAAVVGAPDDNLLHPCAAPATVPGSVNTDGNRTIQSYGYTSFGELAQVDECVEGKTYSTKYSYEDTSGRQSVVTYPTVDDTALSVKYNYTNLGFLQYVSDMADQKPYWVALAMNAAGQVTEEKTRNGVKTVSTRNPAMGWLLNSTATAVADNNTLLQKWSNKFDEVGNLRSRWRSEPVNMADSVETFGYDALDRLTSSEVKVASENYDKPESFAYDKLGNLTQKGGKTYTYTGCGGRPHAVCQVGASAVFAYDGNGNMMSGNDHTVTYTPYNKVSHIEGKSATGDGGVPVVDFAYGAEGNRVVQSVGTTTGGQKVETARTVYVGMGGTGKSMYERTTKLDVIEHVHFLYAGGTHGGNAFAVQVVSQKNASARSVATKYNHFDHLGSVSAMSDDLGQVLGASAGGADATVLGYDAWGARRNPDGRPAGTTLNLQAGHREFTGHETIPGVGLVNMNGRVYDPILGRFLSPDPNVQAVADLQSYNRYSYVLNNPLKYTDPTGYLSLGFLSDPMFYVGVFEAAFGVAICAGSGPGCLLYGAVMLTFNSSVAIMSGAHWDQVLKGDAIGIAAGLLGGGLGGAIADTLGGSPLAMILGGAVGGAATAAISTSLLGGSLGQNMLVGALMGATTAAMQSTIQGQNPLSKADAGQQGGARLESGGAKTGGPGAAWDWAKGDVNALFNDDYTGFSDEFIKRMQPVFDRQGLNVDLSNVGFEVGGPTNFTEGYDITLQGGELDRPFNQVLGDTLHELGHVVQFQNAPGMTGAEQIHWVESLAGAQKADAIHLYGDAMARYGQDPYLANAPLGTLAQSKLLSPSFTLEAQAERFSDLLYWGR